MKPVEAYVSFSSTDVVDVLQSDNILQIQGQNLFLKTDTYSKEDVETFLKRIVSVVDKIAIEKNNGNVLIVVNKFKEDVIEPFSLYEDISEILNGDIEKIIDIITTDTYEYEI